MDVFEINKILRFDLFFEKIVWYCVERWCGGGNGGD